MSCWGEPPIVESTVLKGSPSREEFWKAVYLTCPSQCVWTMVYTSHLLKVLQTRNFNEVFCKVVSEYLCVCEQCVCGGVRSARSHVMCGPWACGPLVINWEVQPGIWEKAEDPKVSGRSLLGITSALTVNYNCPRMIVKDSLIYGRRKVS